MLFAFPFWLPPYRLIMYGTRSYMSLVHYGQEADMTKAARSPLALLLASSLFIFAHPALSQIEGHGTGGEWLTMEPSSGSGANGAGTGAGTVPTGSVTGTTGTPGGTDGQGSSGSTNIATRNAPLNQIGPRASSLGSSSTAGSSGLIDAFGECSWVDNAGTPATAFIPLGSAIEWNLFRQNRPQQVSVPACCRPATVSLCDTNHALDYGRAGDQQSFTANGGLAQATVMCATQSWQLSAIAGTCEVAAVGGTDTGDGGPDCHGCNDGTGVGPESESEGGDE